MTNYLKWMDESVVREMTVTDPVTGVTLTGSSWRDLSKKWLKFLAAENRPIHAEWRQEFDTLICAQNKKAPCRNVSDRGPRNIGRLQIESFIRASLNWINAFRFAPKEEAERRAAICAVCPENVVVAKGCGRCWSYITGVLSLISAFRTSQDVNLNACYACGCPLKIKVHAPDQALADDPFEYPSNCWIPASREAGRTPPPDT